MNSNNRLDVELEIKSDLEDLSPVIESEDHATINTLSTVLEPKGREHISGSERSRMRPWHYKVGSVW